MEFDLEKEEWTTSPFLKLNYQQIEKKVNSVYMRDILRLQKVFEEIDDAKALRVLKELRQDVEKMREKLWIIELLTTEAIIKKSLVWKDISKEIGSSELIPSDDLTLTFLIDSGITNFREKIEEISKLTEKQWAIEKKLNEIVEKTKEVRLQMIVHKTTNTHILTGVEEIQQLLDDQLNLLLMMKSSPYIKPVLNKAISIETKLILIQDTLENWIKCQRGWMYLEPILSSEDIRKKMPTEKLKFDTVDKSYR